MAVPQYPRIFPTIFVTMVRIGEETGRLTEGLERLADWMERHHRVSQKARSALTYPLFVLALACVLTLLLFYKVLPGFVSIFRDMHVPLPLITQFVMACTDAVRNPGARLALHSRRRSGWLA